MTETRVTDQECSDCFNSLWSSAFKAQPFDAICTLLRVDGMQEANWDPLAESEAAFKDYNWHLKAQSDELSDKSQWRVGLLMYCQACEMSAVHDMLANLLRIQLNQPYRLDPLGSLRRAAKRRMWKWYPPSAKVKWHKLRGMAEEAGKSDLVRLIDNLYDDQVRNAFSHSDYIISDEHFRWTEGGLAEQIPLQRVSNLISNALTFFSFFIGIRDRLLTRVSGWPRYHRWPNYQVLELLKTDGKLDGFQLHFSNGSSARFRRAATGVDCMNILFETDGTISFMIGYLDALKKQYVVDGKEVQFGNEEAVNSFD
jgi:hypothetical protein